MVSKLLERLYDMVFWVKERLGLVDDFSHMWDGPAGISSPDKSWPADGIMDAGPVWTIPEADHAWFHGALDHTAPIVARTIPRTILNHKMITGVDLPAGEAEVEVVIHELAFGRRSYSFRWAGPKTASVRLGREFTLFYSPIDKLPWKLRQVSHLDTWSLCADYVRADGWLYPLAVLVDTRLRMVNALRWVSDRVLLTLMVWGLAWIPQTESPHWRHIGKRREL